MQIALCTSFNKNYQNWAAVSLNSVLINTKSKSKIRLVLVSDITYESCIPQLRCILDKFDFTIDNPGTEFDGLPELKHVGLVTYWRLLLPSVLNKYGIIKSIYFDVDTLIIGDLSELYQLELNSLFCLGCLDINSEEHVERLQLSQNFIINGGVILMDVLKMNSINWLKDLRELHKMGKIKWVDQDALNILLDNKIGLLPQSWNIQSGNFQNGYKGEVNILHFTESNNTKPWNSNCRHPYFNVYRTYIRKTGFIWSYFKLETLARWKKLIKQ
jgi:lipopolysaccharide biosynthesis glycosyltransferase